MRVELSSIDDFIAEVRESLAGGARLMENCVRFRIDRVAQQEEEVSFDVFYHATAVVENGAERYLLELAGAWTGEDEGSDKAGSAKANETREELEMQLAVLGVKVRRGKIEVI